MARRRPGTQEVQLPKILGIKVRHYVPLPAFEKAIEEMQRLGAGLPVSLQRYPDYGLAICTFGSLDVVGCDTDLSAEPRGAVVLVRVRGLQELARRLAEAGDSVLSGPETTPEGWTMRVRHRGGNLVDYVESH